MSKRSANLKSAEIKNKTLSQIIKSEFNKVKIDTLVSKEQFDEIFQDCNSKFMDILNETTELGIINDELLDYLSQIQKAYVEKFGEPVASEDIFTESDNDSVLSKSDTETSEVVATPPPTPVKKSTVKKEIKKDNKKEEDNEEEKKKVKKIVKKGKKKEEISEEPSAVSEEASTPETKPKEKKKVRKSVKKKKEDDDEDD